jgi:lipopolysaccharide/colanic/teichoic acid biosynthesis glycosyltransferase
VRLGKDGRPFTLYKLRTMRHNCEAQTGPRWAVPADPRVTCIGRFLRASHIDELPQLWNVLRGEMALVGPRPERPELVKMLETAIPHYRERLRVRPGLTGVAQLQLPPDSTLDDVRAKVAYDLFYIRRMGLRLDVGALVGTGLKLAGVRRSSLRHLLGLRTPGEVCPGSGVVCPPTHVAADLACAVPAAF